MSGTPRLRRRAKGARPYFFDDPTSDKLLSIVMALAGEVSVLHDRLDTTLRLLEAKGVCGTADLEAFEPDAALRAERDAWREEFIARILRVVHVELEAGRRRRGRALPEHRRGAREELVAQPRDLEHLPVRAQGLAGAALGLLGGTGPKRRAARARAPAVFQTNPEARERVLLVRFWRRERAPRAGQGAVGGARATAYLDTGTAFREEALRRARPGAAPRRGAPDRPGSDPRAGSPPRDDGAPLDGS